MQNSESVFTLAASLFVLKEVNAKFVLTERQNVIFCMRGRKSVNL